MININYLYYLFLIKLNLHFDYILCRCAKNKQTLFSKLFLLLFISYFNAVQISFRKLLKVSDHLKFLFSNISVVILFSHDYFKTIRLKKVLYF